MDKSKAALWGLQWDIQRITNNGESYKLGTGSHNVVVGIVDTGIDRDHRDLVKNLMPGSKNFVPAGGFQGTESSETAILTPLMTSTAMVAMLLGRSREMVRC